MAKDFAKLLAAQISGDTGFADDMDRERLNGEVAVLIYNAREKAGLTQKALADMVGTHQPVIARLENAEYDGRNMELLRKIVFALGGRLSISFFGGEAASVEHDQPEVVDVIVKQSSVPTKRVDQRLPGDRGTIYRLVPESESSIETRAVK